MCRVKNSPGAWWARSRAASAPGVATSWPSSNSAFFIRSATVHTFCWHCDLHLEGAQASERRLQVLLTLLEDPDGFVHLRLVTRRRIEGIPYLDHDEPRQAVPAPTGEELLPSHVEVLAEILVRVPVVRSSDELAELHARALPPRSRPRA